MADTALSSICSVFAIGTREVLEIILPMLGLDLLLS